MYVCGNGRDIVQLRFLQFLGVPHDFLVSRFRFYSIPLLLVPIWDRTARAERHRWCDPLKPMALVEL
jgi:hypothetical protein